MDSLTGLDSIQHAFGGAIDKEQQKGTTMGSPTKDTMVEVEKEALADEASDEMLEIAAETTKDKRSFIIGYCSALSVCEG
jgi:hypothetical protein